MNFHQEHMQAHGCGLYQSLRPQLLPRLWLIYCDNPSDSGKVHSTVKQRWLAGDAAVVKGMQQVAQCAEQGRWVGLCVGGVDEMWWANETGRIEGNCVPWLAGDLAVVEGGGTLCGAGQVRVRIWRPAPCFCGG
jgi:hypothetical protein